RILFMQGDNNVVKRREHWPPAWLSRIGGIARKRGARRLRKLRPGRKPRVRDEQTELGLDGAGLIQLRTCSAAQRNDVMGPDRVKTSAFVQPTRLRVIQLPHRRVFAGLAAL